MTNETLARTMKDRAASLHHLRRHIRRQGALPRNRWRNRRQHDNADKPAWTAQSPAWLQAIRLLLFLHSAFRALQAEDQDRTA
jgi:hypothetical protein